MSTFVTATELAELDPTKRVNHALGMIIGADDLRQDQRYLTARDERHQRVLHGWGVVSGLLVDYDEDLRLRVHPGLAVDGVGRSICVDRTQCADLLGWLRAQGDAVAEREVTVWVLLCHDSCETDLLPVPSGPCQSLDDSLAPSRVVDSFRLELSLEEPVARTDAVEGVTAVLAADGEQGRRASIREHVTDRGAAAEFAGPCLDPDGNACVPLASTTVTLTGSGATLAFGADPTSGDVTRTAPLLLSTAFLQEWLLRVESGGAAVTPDLGIFDLNDTPDDPGSVQDGSILQWTLSESEWSARRPALDMLEDVDLRGSTPDDETYLGFDTGAGTWQPKKVVIPDPESPEVDGQHVYARDDSMVGIVAAGVLELEIGDRDDHSDWATDEELTGRFRSQYGGLRLEGAVGSASSGLARVSFAGLAEVFERYPTLEGRQLVVEATCEELLQVASVQVANVGAEGIVLRYVVRPDDSDGSVLRALAEVFGVDVRSRPRARRTLAVHLQISVFDDAEIEGVPRIRATDHREDVEALWRAEA